MKKLLFIFISTLSVFFLFSCTYKMPYKPGVTIEGEDTFYKNKKQWENDNIENYSFTFTRIHSSYPSANYTVDITVKDGKVENCDLKEYRRKAKESLSSEEWTKEEDNFYGSHSDLEQFSIDSIFESFDSRIRNAYKSFSEYPDCYYANYSFTFSDEEPYVLSCKGESVLMIEDAVGNGARIKMQISNFKKL